MGQTIARARKQASAADGGSKIAYNAVNENLLNKIIDWVSSYAGAHPEESKLKFKAVMEWPTSLKIDDFSGGAFEQRGDDMVSTETVGKDNLPVMWLHKDTDGAYVMRVLTVSDLAQVLNIAKDRKLDETRACLEANPDPLANIAGDRFASVTGEDLSAYRYMEEIMKSPREEADDDEANMKKVTLKLVMHVQKLDSDLLKYYAEAVSATSRLTPALVEQDVNLLKEFCGEDEDQHVLEEISFTSEHKFQNGCRSPPWRQVHGDICYIEVKPHDEDPFFITAGTLGYFVNKGWVKEKNDLDYEAASEVNANLVELLKTRSAKFAELIVRQDLSTLGAIKDDSRDKEVEREKELEQRRKEEEEQRSKGRKDNKKHLEPTLTWIADDKKDERKKKTVVKDDDKKKTPRTTKTQKSRMESRGKSKTPYDEDSFSESSSESEEEEEVLERRQDSGSDLPSDYWQIQKLVKYLKGGNQTATIIALCAMRDFNLNQETIQLAIRDVGGLEVLINLLDTEDIKCKIGALNILKYISKNAQIRRAIADLGGLQTMVKILRDPNKELKALAAETIANVAKFRRARRTVRQHGGIKKLVGLLDCAPLNSVSTPEHDRDVEVARCGALALWSCSKSTKNKQAMRKAGAIPLLARLLKSVHESMLIPVVGTLQECASEPSYRLAIRTEGMIEDLVTNLKSENAELQMHCASAIFKCAEEKETRDLVNKYGGLHPLVNLLNNVDNKELLAAATGAIWKCAISAENVQKFQEMKAIDLLVNLLNDQPEEVLVNVVGALGECAKDPPNRAQIRKAGGISPLVQLLTGTNQALLINVTRAVGQCAEEPDNMAIIDRLDGVRLLWSLLKNQNTEVQASAAWAICPCIENAKDAGEMVRSFVGGLELIVSLLKSDDQEVLASVCAAIANIAKDEENLAVITDHGVVPMLAKLTNTTDDRLRRHLAEAIARCCSWGNNRVSFGNEKAVAPLVYYLKSKDKQVHRSTARALFQLSKDPDNCITMHEAGVVKPLMEMVGSEDTVLQEAAAGCISNIRRLALANEKAKYS